jgi:Flp pilus assembly protein TadB
MTSWLDWSPVAQILLGLVLFVSGALGTVVLLGAGILWGLTLFATAAGPLLIGNGYAAWRRRRELEAQARIVLEAGPELLDAIVRERRSGDSPVAMLRRRGITDFRIRQKLLRDADEQAAAVPPREG